MDSPSAVENETPNQKQARLRRERRQARLAADGSDRLNKIMGVQGRQASSADTGITSSDTPNCSTIPLGRGGPHAATVEDAPDPEEMEISPTQYGPRRSTGPWPQGQGSQIDPSQLADMFGAAGNNSDPIMAVLQQLMQQPNSTGGSGTATAGRQAPQQPDLAGILAEMVGGAPSQAGQPGQATGSSYRWRIIHTIVAIVLALHVILSSPVSFTGSKDARDEKNLVGINLGSRLSFWFATTQVVLQSSRFVLQKGQPAASGMVGMAASLLPHPYGGYVRLLGHYSTILSTTMNDGLVILFVLGMVACWNGMTT